MTTMTIEQRAAEIKAQRKAGVKPVANDKPLTERIGKWLATKESNIKAATSNALDYRNALREARIEDGCRW